jgi:hypothetical protein
LTPAVPDSEDRLTEDGKIPTFQELLEAAHMVDVPSELWMPKQQD